METSKEIPEPEQPEEPLPEINLAFSDNAENNQSGEPVGREFFDRLEEEMRPMPASGGNTPPPPNEPPAPPMPDEPDEDPFEAFEKDVRRPIDPIQLEPESTASLIGGQWIEIPAELSGGLRVVEDNDFVITNNESLSATVDGGEYAVVLKNGETETNGILRLSEHDHFIGQPGISPDFTEILDEKIASVENFDANTRAIVCAPLEPLPTTDEGWDDQVLDATIESNELTQQRAVAIGMVLEQNFGPDNVSLFVQGEAQEINVIQGDSRTAITVHNDDIVDIHVIGESEGSIETSVSETPQQALMNVEGINELLEIGQESRWIITPAGEAVHQEDRDFSVNFKVDDSNPDDPRFTMSFKDGEETVGESSAMVDDDLMSITNLPIETSSQDVDVAATLARRFEFVARLTGCDQIQIPGAENMSQIYDLEGQPNPGLETLQTTYDQTAQKLGYIRSEEGNWLRDL